MKSNIRRQLTLTVRITDDEKSKDIWMSHLHSTSINGFLIEGIAEGDAIEERDLLEELIENISSIDFNNCQDTDKVQKMVNKYYEFRDEKYNKLLGEANK